MRRRPSASRPFAPQLPQLAGAIRWLREHQVDSATIARAFGTRPPYVRLLHHRARPTPTQHSERPRRLSVRSEEDTILLSEVRQSALEALADDVDATFERHAHAYTFVAGVDALRQFLIPLGFPSSVPLVRLKARILRHIAWLRSHTGRSQRAASSAVEAIQLYRRVWRQIGDRRDLDAIGDAALIASNAWLLARQPQQALAALRLGGQIDDQLQRPSGAEHHRQQATALLQAHHDAAALDHLRDAERAMCRDGHGHADLQLAVTMRRNLLMARDQALADQTITDVDRRFGRDSLEALMARHWAAASALCAHRDEKALILLNDTANAEASYGHQATIAHLLTLTPALALPAALRTRWVRYALYVNAFSHT